MVDAEDLAALDLLLWLRTGQLAARQLGCNQSTVSRRVAHCADTFKLSFKRIGGEWQLRGHELLLTMERQIHQLHRLLGGAPLRLECTPWEAPALALPPPAGWITGVFDHMGLDRPLQLLRERVIDAWISNAYLDLPDPDDPELQVLDLSRFPLWLMAAADHPLAGEHGLRPGDLERFPSLAVPDGMYPNFEAGMRQQGLWNTPVRMRRYCREDWEGHCTDRVTMSVGNCVSQRLSPQLVQLDWDLGLASGQALVVHRDLAETGPIMQLMELLRSRAATLQDVHPVFQTI